MSPKTKEGQKCLSFEQQSLFVLPRSWLKFDIGIGQKVLELDSLDGTRLEIANRFQERLLAHGLNNNTHCCLNQSRKRNEVLEGSQ